jgi:uncharacterized protein (UPF0332 family)
MNPEDFVALARILATGSGEAHWRSAVSRANYGCFHVALDFLSSLGVVLPRSAAVHDKVAYCLQNSGDADLTEAGRKLCSLREDRNLADYRLDRPAATKSVAFKLREAEEIIAIIKHIRKDAPSVRQPIREYARSVLRLTVQGAD